MIVYYYAKEWGIKRDILVIGQVMNYSYSLNCRLTRYIMYDGYGKDLSATDVRYNKIGCILLIQIKWTNRD